MKHHEIIEAMFTEVAKAYEISPLHLMKSLKAPINNNFNDEQKAARIIFILLRDHFGSTVASGYAGMNTKLFCKRVNYYRSTMKVNGQMVFGFRIIQTNLKQLTINEAA